MTAADGKGACGGFFVHAGCWPGGATWRAVVLPWPPGFRPRGEVGRPPPALRTAWARRDGAGRGSRAQRRAASPLAAVHPRVCLPVCRARVRACVRVRWPGLDVAGAAARARADKKWLDRVATRIQACVRRWLAQHKLPGRLRAMHNAATVIQSVWRRVMVRGSPPPPPHPPTYPGAASVERRTPSARPPPVPSRARTSPRYCCSSPPLHFPPPHTHTCIPLLVGYAV